MKISGKRMTMQRDHKMNSNLIVRDLSDANENHRKTTTAGIEPTVGNVIPDEDSEEVKPGPDRWNSERIKQPFLSISGAAPLISLSFATGYCLLMFLQRHAKRSDWRKSL
jgi:hypothetical protein